MGRRLIERMAKQRGVVALLSLSLVAAVATALWTPSGGTSTAEVAPPTSEASEARPEPGAPATADGGPDSDEYVAPPPKIRITDPKNLDEVFDDYPEEDAAIAARQVPSFYLEDEPGQPALPEDALSFEDEFINPTDPVLCPDEEALPSFLDEDEWAANSGSVLAPCSVWVSLDGIGADLSISDNGQGIPLYRDEDLQKMIDDGLLPALAWREVNEDELVWLNLDGRIATSRYPELGIATSGGARL